MEPELFYTQILLFLISFVVCTISGFVLSNFLKINLPAHNLYSTIFISNAVGVAFIICSYATFWLGIHTIFSVGLILYSLYFFLNRKQKVHNSYKILLHKQQWIVVIVIGVFILMYYSISFYNSESPLNTFDLNSDYLYYARISRYLTEAKQENYFHYFNILSPEKYNGLMLYHYFDLWLTNLYSQISSVSIYSLYRLVTTPYFLILILTGLLAIAKQFLQLKREYYYLLGCPVIIFWGNIDFFLFQIAPAISTYHHNFFYYGLIKLSPIIFYLIGAMLAFINRDRMLLLFMLLFIPLAYSVTLPAIIASVGIFLIVLIVGKEFKWNDKEILFFVVYTAILIVVLVHNRPPAVMSYVNDPRWVINALISNYITVQNIILGSTLYMFMLYIIPVVIILVHYKILRTDRTILYMIGAGVIIFFVSLTGWAVMFYKTDSVQIFSNITLPMMAVMSYFLLLYIYSLVQSKLSKSMIIGAFVITCILNVSSQYSIAPISNDYKSFLKEIDYQYRSGSIKTKTGILLYGTEDYQEYPNTKYTSLFGNLGDLLFLKDDKFHCIGASDYNIPFEYSSLAYWGNNEIISMGYYYKYIQQKLKDQNYRYKDQEPQSIYHVYDFINTHNVSFAFVSARHPYVQSIKSMSKSSYYYKEGNLYFCILK